MLNTAENLCAKASLYCFLFVSVCRKERVTVTVEKWKKIFKIYAFRAGVQCKTVSARERRGTLAFLHKEKYFAHIRVLYKENEGSLGIYTNIIILYIVYNAFNNP